MRTRSFIKMRRAISRRRKMSRKRLLMRMTKKLNMLLRTKGFGSPEVRKASKQLRATLQDSQVRGVSITQLIYHRDQ